VIPVMTEKARDALLTSSFKLGGDASIATGPVGAGASATVTTDLVSFSRSKGAFVGVSFEGAVIRPDVEANRVFYGQNVSPVDVLIRDSVRNPAAAPLQDAVRAAAR
jgi:lipid-binding SYLF domain-containing protein